MNTDKEGFGLLKEYSRILTNSDIKLLEVGVYHGGFLEWMKENYPLVKLYGIDISNISIDGVTTDVIDQNDTEKLEAFGKKHGKFDVIIDDASHKKDETTKTFSALWSHLNVGGKYIIEDWGVGYWAELNPQMFGFGKGMQELVFHIAQLKGAFGISDIEIIYKEPKCSMAIFTKAK